MWENWKHNLTEDKREVGGSPELVCGKASFCRGAGAEMVPPFVDKRWWRWRYMLLIVLHVRWGGGGWISVGMGLKNGGLFLLLSSSDVNDFTDWVPVCCVSPGSETGPESGGSQSPNQRQVTLAPRCSGEKAPAASGVKKEESRLSSVRV